MSDINLLSNLLVAYKTIYAYNLFQVKTRSEMAVLFYNTGPSSNQDYVALELWKGRPRLLVDQVRKARVVVPKYVYFVAFLKNKT